MLLARRASECRYEQAGNLKQPAIPIYSAKMLCREVRIGAKKLQLLDEPAAAEPRISPSATADASYSVHTYDRVDGSARCRLLTREATGMEKLFSQVDGDDRKVQHGLGSSDISKGPICTVANARVRCNEFQMFS